MQSIWLTDTQNSLKVIIVLKLNQIQIHQSSFCIVDSKVIRFEAKTNILYISIHFYLICHKQKSLTNKASMNHHTIIFFTGIVNKMSQLFSELNYLYINAMLPKPNHKIEEQIKADDITAEQKKQQKTQTANNQNVIIKVQKQQVQSKAATLYEEKVKEEDKQLDFVIPKTPLSSFMIFYNEHREEIKKNFPQCNSKEVKSMACNLWKDLSKQEKQVYYKQHKQQAIKYNKALQTFRQNMQRMPNHKRQLLNQKIRKKKQNKDKKAAQAQESEDKSKSILSDI